LNLEVLKQTLASLDINPDEIEDERYAKAFRILFAIIEILSEYINTLKAEIQKLRDEINLLKGQYFTNWIEKSSSFIPISKYFSVKCLKS
jgi:hypothetical protein